MLCLGQHVLVVTPAQLRQVGQLLDPDDRVIEGGLQRLGHGVGQDHRDHHGKDVGDLSGQLKHNDGGGNGVGNRARQGRRTYGRATEKVREDRSRRAGKISGCSAPWLQGGK